MAAGEYVSVSSQSDTENADLARERNELATDYEAERRELTAIYVERGLTPELATEVADQLMRSAALGAHSRDELGISELTAARPLQAAVASAISFAVGAVPPIVVAIFSPPSLLGTLVTISTLVILAGMGAAATGIGGAVKWRGAVRVAFLGSARDRRIGPCRSAHRDRGVIPPLACGALQALRHIPPAS